VGVIALGFCLMHPEQYHEVETPNKSLQRTFDPLPILAVAKTGIATNAAELRR